MIVEVAVIKGYGSGPGENAPIFQSGNLSLERHNIEVLGKPDAQFTKPVRRARYSVADRVIVYSMKRRNKILVAEIVTRPSRCIKRRAQHGLERPKEFGFHARETGAGLSNSSNCSTAHRDPSDVPQGLAAGVRSRQGRLSALQGAYSRWGWIGPWLRLMDGRTRLHLYECRQGSILVGMAILSRQTLVRRGLIRVNTHSLHSTPGIGPELFIEYNGCLARSGYESLTLSQLIQDLDESSKDWDEVRLANIPSRIWSDLDTSSTKLRKHSDDSLSTWITPLQDATDVGAIISRLRAGRRSKIARSFREYERNGKLQASAASTVEQAIHDFRSMGDLHTRRWNLAGLPGSFANHEWVRFHEDVIRTGKPRNEVQIVHVQCGTRTIGYTYNFLWRGSVLMLQSGFTKEHSNHLRPGYVSHILAMELNARLGYKSYDFLAGDADYKSVLAYPGEQLVTGRLQRPRWRLRAEDMAVRSVRKLRSLKSPDSVANDKTD